MLCDGVCDEAYELVRSPDDCEATGVGEAELIDAHEFLLSNEVGYLLRDLEVQLAVSSDYVAVVFFLCQPQFQAAFTVLPWDAYGRPSLKHASIASEPGKDDRLSAGHLIHLSRDDGTSASIEAQAAMARFHARNRPVCIGSRR